MQRFCFVPTPWGDFTLIAEGNTLVGTRLPYADRNDCLENLRLNFPEAEHNARLLPALRAAVRDYFRGKKCAFAVALDECGMTPFQVAVVRACRKIPFGKTCSYGELAERAGYPNAARAAGSVMRRNRFPLIVPCHRVIASGGRIGSFSGPGGITLKQRLLDLEASATTPFRVRSSA